MPQLLIPALAIVGVTGTAAVVTSYIIGAALTLGATRLITKRALKKARAGSDGGGRVQIPPATDNKIPVVYGSAFMSGPIIDAYLSTDQKTMYYVIALSEKTDNGTISFGDIYYDGKLVTFTSDGNGGTTRVQSLTTNTSTPQVDNRVDGNLFMYFYNNGSTNPTNTTLNAYDVMPSWTSSMAMTNCAFVIVEVTYNTNAATTSLGAVTAEVINTESGQATGVYRPGTAIYDYLTNTRYGCAIPSTKIDNTSLSALNTYSDQTITYEPVGGGSATQARYRINGPLDTAASCLDNLQILVDSCDSWLQYSEMTAEWKVVMNKSYTGTPFVVNSSNLIGGIQISPLDLNETYNELEVAYPNANIKDQTDYQVLLLSDYQAGLLSPNEAVNRLNISYPIVNNAVQAKYLGVRRLLQSREDLVINFNLDFSGIQIEAGDVISVSYDAYGWTNKLFRVSQVAESKDQEGRLGASVTAFEYNATIYDDQAITDYIPAFNTGLLNPNVFDQPTAPVITDGAVANASTTSFNVSSNVPGNGAIIYMDFNYGNTSNVQQHLLYRTVQPGPGTTFTSGSTVTINVNDIPAGNLYWSTTARNDFAGRQSNSSALYVWNGPKVSSYNSGTGVGGIGINELQPNIITPDLFPPDVQPIQIVDTLPGGCNVATEGTTVYLKSDGKLYVCDGTAFTAVASNNLITGNIVATQIANVFGNTITGTIDNAGFPSANLIGEIVGSQLANAAITDIKIAANAVTSDKILANAIVAGKIAADAVGANQILANAITAVKIAANAITTDKIEANAIVTNKIQAGAISSALLAANAVIAGTIAADAMSLGGLISNTSKTYDGANFQFELGTGTTIGGYGGAGIFRTQKTTSFAIGGITTGSDSFALAGQSTDGSAQGYGAALVNSTTAGGTSHRTEAYLTNSSQAGIFIHTSTGKNAVLANSTYAIATNGDVNVVGNITASGTITPFTGSHNGIMDNLIVPDLGDIIIDDYVIAKQSVNDTLTQMSMSSASNQPAIGVYSGDCDPGYIPLAISQPGPNIQIAINTWVPGPVILANSYANLLDDNRVIIVNSVGEGQINVIGENGNIAVGDLIVTSSTAGKGMKQSDDIIRSYTVAKAREAATFSSPTEEKQIACVYLAG